jgi:hypothetical protein
MTAAQLASTPVWVETPSRFLRVINRDFTGIGYAQEPYDRSEALALDSALGGANLDLGALFMDAVRTAPPAPGELEAVALASNARAAQITIEPRVFLWAMKGDRARLELSSKVDVEVPGVRSFDLSCRTYTALVLPNKGDGGWTDEGLHTLNKSVSRCARDVIAMVRAELSVRRRGLWKTPVEMERLQLIEYKPYSGWDPLRYEGLVIHETETVLSYAVAHGRGLGHLRNIRHIVDKSMITHRGPA